jgi:acetyl-CoA synthase
VQDRLADPSRLLWSDVSSTVFALGFAHGQRFPLVDQPGEFRKILIYNKDRIFAFALPWAL